MEFKIPRSLFLVLLCLLSYSHAYVFYAGGRDGWVLHPSEDYNHWAGRNRFQVNDTIVFKYKKGSNSVLVVNKDDYDKCNKKNPIVKFEEGDSVFKFDRSGPFFFISGTDENCEKGQKLIVVVLAVRGPKPHYPPPPSVSPSPVSQPPTPAVSPYPPSPAPAKSPSSPTPTPAISPSSPTPAPAISPSSPTPAPAISPSSPTPAPGVSPSSPTPAMSPAPANAPSYPTPVPAPTPVTTSPTPSPSANTPTSTPQASPPSPPATTPSPSTTPGSAQTPSPSGSPGGSGNPSSSNETAPSPPNGRSAAWNVSPSSLLVYSVTVVLGFALSQILGAH